MTKNMDMTALDSMGLDELAKLPGAMLLDLKEEIAAAQAAIGQRVETLAKAIDRKYARRAKNAMTKAGKSHGTVNLTDGEITVKVEAKRRTSWDQDKLTRRLAKLSTKQRAQFVTERLSVTEAALKKAPASLRASLVAARTETVNAPSYTLERAA